MRYQIFNQRAGSGSAPVITAPWRWLAYHLISLLSLKWDWCRLEDSKTGDTLMEWARASRVPAGPVIYQRRSVGVIRAVKAACTSAAIKWQNKRG